MIYQINYCTILLLLYICVYLCGCQPFFLEEIVQEAQNKDAITLKQPALSGVSNKQQNISDVFVVYQNTAKGNKAASISGEARSGSTNIWGSVVDGGNAENGTFLGSYNYAGDNRGVSQTSSAVSGEQSIFNQIQDSVVINRGGARNNDAVVLGGPDVSAISGIEILAKNITKEQKYSFGGSLITVNGAYSNVATNVLEGQGVAGVASSIGELHFSDASLNNVAQDNTAIAMNGIAVAGAQNNVLKSNTSQLRLNGTTSLNSATTEGGDAVAGIQNNVGEINGIYSFYFPPFAVPNGTYLEGANFTLPSLVTYDRATENVAIGRDDGKAVAGVQSSIRSVNGGLVRIESYSVKNRATTVGDGDGPQDAVAGVALNFNSVNNSDINVAAFSQDNVALNYNQDPTYNSHAIAGVGIVVGSMQDSSLSIIAESIGNFAYASNGDAIAGNNIQVVNDMGGNQLHLPQFLYSRHNTANATSGDSVTNSVISVAAAP